MNKNIKKTVVGGLVGLMALGGVSAFAPAAFAQDADELTRDERRAARQEARAERRADKIETLTSVLNISEDELRAARQDGQTLADIAEAQGVELQDVIDALVANAQARIDAKVAAGDIDAERAAEKLERIEDRITARANGEQPEGRRGHRGLLRGQALAEGADV